jgi:LCP family protein required for cell wall assembly
MTESEQRQPAMRRRHRVLTFPNFAFAATSIAVFIIVAYLIQTNLGALLAAIVASSAGAIVWWASTSAESHDQMGEVLVNLPMLGAIPPHAPVSAPSLTDSDTTSAYDEFAAALESQTHGRVLLISSAELGQGASTVAMNVAISAARSGRRIVLIDGDAAHPSVSRFMSSGASPGITDIAAGNSTLREAARIWSISESSTLPVVPSGEPTLDVESLGGINVSDAIESIAAHADLILIDAPPALESDVTSHLANHADGTILVISDDADSVVVAEAGAKLSEIGAPILGYVTIRANSLLVPLATLWKPITLRIAIGAMLLLGVLTAVTGAQILDSWNNIEREEFALSEAVAILSETDSTTSTTDVSTSITAAGVAGTSTTSTTTVPLPEESYETILLIGGDEDSGASDVILYLVMPTNGADPFMMSFPRDLYVDNPCTGGSSRINALSHGCRSKGINGGTLLSVQISEMTGIDVDHFTEFTFDGFVDIIDAVGGVEICVGEYPVRDLPEAHLELPAGCTLATGTQALSWVRSRHTQILKDGAWRRMPGTSDLMRNTRQQDVIFELAGKIKSFESPQQLTKTIASVAGAFTLSDTLSLADAISLAWSLRGIEVEEINRLVIPVRLTRSPTNQSILVSTLTIKEVIAEMYGDTLPAESR